MKLLKRLGLFLLAFSCSTTELVDYWKNPDIDVYSPSKVLLVGMTSNLEAREKFEKQLQEEYESRGIEAVMSLELFDSSFTTEKKTEQELKVLENDLINDGFDTVLFTRVVGLEDKITYKKNYDGYENTHRKFREDYLKYQDAFYNPDYYEEYTVYHSETAMYCLCPTKDRELIWKGYIDITDPESINETVNDYVRLIVIVLEEEQLINSTVMEEKMDEEAIK
ncbi:hypothetical protein MBM09_08260 [Flaviramulus sp. BrNp1-15]|uniref:hypothetical protein n=1 Tax=Flaviramulus sp. BrNp1-15 TaxID=2916754 RepID=UPI001EE80064|nr:hypothetical protein [Flaviramulus sp. BrNp1-15]ULC57912.1 hypothetical protein MBM09_08260 [Flaviramulus sp. BrNp1-15]